VADSQVSMSTRAGRDVVLDLNLARMVSLDLDIKGRDQNTSRRPRNKVSFQISIFFLSVQRSIFFIRSERLIRPRLVATCGNWPRYENKFVYVWYDAFLCKYID
jgi:hypothetical protein